MLTGKGQVQGTDTKRETNAGWAQTAFAQDPSRTTHKDLSLPPHSLLVTSLGDLLPHLQPSWCPASGFLIPGPRTLPSKDGIRRTVKLAGERS